ncbi:hypothetical protein Prudu_003581 [Prunus dulcis]|uniref:Uncharacterized protein n=1 Tax=Prunus dulcis TaxID=3755 RepID=A0A4Y1QTE0_PRUDU|nr:hypothetical protein Prudu_003581 [Prunus dulcis]
MREWDLVDNFQGVLEYQTRFTSDLKIKSISIIGGAKDTCEFVTFTSPKIWFWFWFLQFEDS